MDKMKEKILDIAKEFKRICEKHHLRYYLAFGTFLGAVRHKGFIPWDDDIDFHMPRPDYNKFLEICQDEINPKFALRTMKEEKYIYEFAKIDDTTTTLVESFNKANGYKGGVYIDIFPLEAVPDNLKEQQLFLKKLDRTKFMASWGLVDFSSKKYPWYKRIIISMSKFINGRKYLLKLDKLLQSYDYDKMQNVLTSIASPRIIIDKKIFNESMEYVFEDTTFVGIKDYDTYLRQLYGDYMTPPPDKDRVTVHCIDYLDLEKPY